MSPDSPDGDHEPPVEGHEFLLRHFPSDPGEYDFDKKYPRASIFHPRKSDTDGLSLNREGSDYPTAKQLLAASSNPSVRDYGGVVAALAFAITRLGLTIKVTKGDHKGHVIIEEINIRIYKSSPEAARVIKDFKDKIIRLMAKNPPELEMRIIPMPKPAKP